MEQSRTAILLFLVVGFRCEFDVLLYFRKRQACFDLIEGNDRIEAFVLLENEARLAAPKDAHEWRAFLDEHIYVERRYGRLESTSAITAGSSW